MQILRRAFADFSGGVNISYSEEVETQQVLRFAQNVRNVQYGALRKRAKTQRLHSSAIGSGAEVQQLFQWEGPVGKQVVAICGGDFYWKLEADPEFTRVALGIDPSIRPSFAVHRVAGVPRLYFVDGTDFYSFDGTFVQMLGGAPALSYIRIYNTRIFGVANDKYLYYSAIDDPEDWTVFSGAGQAAIETYDTDPLNSLHTVGSSLLCIKKNSISRFTGYDITDIQIETGTSGISAEVGAISPHTVVRVEDVVFFLSDRGPYLATESALRFIGLNVEQVFEALSLTQLEGAVAVHNRLRREIWLSIPDPTTDDPENVAVWRYDYRMNAWWGPDFFSGFNPHSLWRYERDDGSESVVIGGTDGFVRDGDLFGDDSHKDDVLADGTGGIPIPMDVRFREIDMGSKEHMKLLSPAQTLTADLGLSGQLVVDFETDAQSPVSVVLSATKKPGEYTYRFRPGVRGRAIYVRLREETEAGSEVTRLNIVAKLGKARWL